MPPTGATRSLLTFRSRSVVASVSPWLGLLARTLGGAILCGFVLAATAAWADTFTIFDTGDTLTVSSSNPSRITEVFPAGLSGPDFFHGEGINVNFSRPPGATFVTTITPPGLVGSIFFGIGEGNGNVSDIMSLAGNTDQLQFVSDSQQTHVSCTNTTDISGCPITEDGTVQVAGTITWDNGVVDTFQFQSDVNEVPEPSSILLLLTGFVGVYAARAGFRFFVHPA